MEGSQHEEYFATSLIDSDLMYQIIINSSDENTINILTYIVHCLRNGVAKNLPIRLEVIPLVFQGKSPDIEVYHSDRTSYDEINNILKAEVDRIIRTTTLKELYDFITSNKKSICDNIDRYKK